MIRRPPRSTQSRSSAASDVYKRQDGVRIIGNAREKASLISFHVDAAHPHDVVTMLDQDGMSCRGGHHCAQPTMIRYGVPATTRASMAFYNKTEELDALAESIKKCIRLFSE